MNPRDRLQYALYLQRLHELFVIKENIAFQYPNAHYNKAAEQIDKVVDKCLDNNIKATVDGTHNLESPNLDHVISGALSSQQKMLVKTDDKYIQSAVEKNTKEFTRFIQNRIEKENYSLQAKIEKEYQKKKYQDMSEEQAKKLIRQKFQDSARKRAKNIVKDALHTNQSQISWTYNVNNGMKYKVWMNGQSKSGVRSWHIKSKIQPVEIDDFFDIFGPKGHAQMMYPGDLYGGAENVANCKCWLHYTNIAPSNLKKKGTIQINPNVQLENENSTTFRANTEKRGLFTKIKTKYKNLSNKLFNRYDDKTLGELIDKGEVTHSKIPLEIPVDEETRDLDRIEEFNKYEFHKYNITIYESVDVEKSKALDLAKCYSKLNKPLKLAEEIVLSHQKPYVINKKGEKEYIGGFVKGDRKRIHIFNNDSEKYGEVLVHELAHTLDKDFMYSNSRIYKKVFDMDKAIWNKINVDEKHKFVTKYAYEFYKRAIKKDSKYHHRIYSEDFAEAVKEYTFNRELLKKKFPNTYYFIKNILEV